MRVALICLQLGVPRTLATTAFVTAFADGLVSMGIDTRIVGLVHWERSWGAGWEEQWNEAALRPFDASAPWIHPPRSSMRDASEAARRGILDTSGGSQGRSLDWYLELLLERELEAFAAGGELALVVYPISLSVMSAAGRVAVRHGWRLLVQSCETMSGGWIDPATKDGYIRSVTESADGLWALSHFLRDYWSGQGLPAERILVQPNVVRRSAFSATPPTQGNSAVYLGNLEHAEIDHLLEIVTAVRRDVPTVRLSIYADATAERRSELEALLGAQDLTDVVTLEQPVPPAEVPRILGAADVLLLPRAMGEFSQAGFPNKLGEYLASGHPVVVTSVGDIPRYLLDRESAFLVAPEDHTAFASAVVTALTDRDLADTVGRGGKHVAEQLLASPVVAKRVIEFIAALPPRDVRGARAADTTRHARTTTSLAATLAGYRIVGALRSLRHRAGAAYYRLRGRG